MNQISRVVLLLASLASAAAANAATGDFTIIAGGSSWISAGYCATCSPVIGRIFNPTLSDGKTVSIFYNSVYSSGNNEKLEFAVSGFLSDPGVGYFNSLTVTTCDIAPSTYSTGAVWQYAYNATYGLASWEWVRSVAGECLFSGSTYSVAVN